jgi:hypothetical protein
MGLQDLQEPIHFRLQSLKKYNEKARVKVQTKNFMGLGKGKKAIESAGGWGGGWGKWAHIKTKKRQEECDLYWSKAQSKEKRHQIDAVEETVWRKKRDSG